MGSTLYIHFVVFSSSRIKFKFPISFNTSTIRFSHSDELDSFVSIFLITECIAKTYKNTRCYTYTAHTRCFCCHLVCDILGKHTILMQRRGLFIALGILSWIPTEFFFSVHKVFQTKKEVLMESRETIQTDAHTCVCARASKYVCQHVIKMITHCYYQIFMNTNNFWSETFFVDDRNHRSHILEVIQRINQRIWNIFYSPKNFFRQHNWQAKKKCRLIRKRKFECELILKPPQNIDCEFIPFVFQIP